MTTARGAGSLRERRPGVWEIRVAAGTDPVTGRVIQRSITFHGTALGAEAYRRELAVEYARRRAVTRAASLLTVGELLERWLLADHPWQPSTWHGYRSNARQLAGDGELAGVRVVSLTPRQLHATFARWSANGARFEDYATLPFAATVVGWVDQRSDSSEHVAVDRLRHL